MLRIDKLLFKSIAPPFLIALAVLTFVVSVHELGTLSELLITRNASLGTILLIIGAILPRILIFSLPLSFLVGVLIGVGGLSGESQITAFRACGVPLRTLLRPILGMGILVGILTGLMTVFILPRTNDVFRLVLGRISLAQATSQIQPRVFNEDFPEIVFYLDDLAVDRQQWSRVFLADSRDPGTHRAIIAASGAWVADSSSRRLQLHLEHGRIYDVNAIDPGKENVSDFRWIDFPIVINRSIAASDVRPPKVAELSTGRLWSDHRNAPPPARLEQLLELHRRFSLPFSVFPFALLGLSLAVSAPRGGRASGFALSLAVVILFYTLFGNGLRLASVGKISPALGAWGANLILAAFGLLVFLKVEKGFDFTHRRATLSSGKSSPNRPSRHPSSERLSLFFQRLNRMALGPALGIARIRFPRILDIYISRGMLAYLLWSVVACGTLFVLLTLFDLLDDIIRNRVPVLRVLDYFAFLTPQILMIVVPMAVLLAVLISFGLLDKNSEITAIKAGGWSLYRTAMPVFLIASFLCVGLFAIQDYVLPYANVRQDDLRRQIKGKPPQTTRIQQKWILGESGRIYNYEYFDGNQDSFVGLNVYEIDLQRAVLLRRISAARARIEHDGSWILEDGWMRDYRAPSFRRIKRDTVRFPEHAGYFEKEIFQPKESAKMTLLQLREYISHLTKTGYNAVELKVELYKKIAFPLSCLVMALLAVPFSFSTEKKGAFYGIGVSIAIAITYWGVSGVFESMGAHGLLIPALAAWAPNILFGAAGLALLFTVKT